MLNKWFLFASLLLITTSDFLLSKVVKSRQYRIPLIKQPKGQRPLDGRIVGGEYTSIKDHPYQVSIQFYNQHICGGAIISPKVILTAAHCSVNGPPEAYSIRVGSSTRNEGGTVARVKEILIHYLYDAVVTDYDVAIFKLEVPLKFSREVQPITIANETTRKSDSGTVTGWGDSNMNSHFLQKVVVPIMDQDSCVQSFVNYETITPRMFCAGFVGKGGKDACQGDSGGPFAVDYKLYGITSWGYDCGSSKFPGVYVRLTDKDIGTWIREKAGL